MEARAASSRRRDAGDEGLDLVVELVEAARQLLGGVLHRSGGLAGGLHRLLHQPHFPRHGHRAGGGASMRPTTSSAPAAQPVAAMKATGIGVGAGVAIRPSNAVGSKPGAGSGRRAFPRRDPRISCGTTPAARITRVSASAPRRRSPFRDPRKPPAGSCRARSAGAAGVRAPAASGWPPASRRRSPAAPRPRRAHRPG